MNGDAQVIAALRERGDPIVAARPVKHWAYFSSRDGANLFREWLVDAGFKDAVVAEEPDRDDLTWRVTYEHVVVPRLAIIEHHTAQAAAQAELFGGAYDGWETSVEG